MIDNAVNALRSVDPALRRAAIQALGRSRDRAAIPPLEYAATTDPDPELRALAVRAVAFLRKQPDHKEPGESGTGNLPQWFGDEDDQAGAVVNAIFIGAALNKSEAAPPPESPLPAPTTEAAWSPFWQQAEADSALEPPPVAYVSPDRRRAAQGYLRQAFRSAASGDGDQALIELAEGLRTDPGLAGNASARRLAVQLTDLPPKQAMASILNQIQAGALNRPKTPLVAISDSFRRRTVILLLELPALFAVMLAFVLVYGYRIKYAGNSFDIEFILPGLFRSITGPVVERALPVALTSAVAVLFFVVVVYYIGSVSGGTGDPMRVITSGVAIQIFVAAMLLFGLLFVPFVRFIPTGQAPDQYFVVINLGWVFVGGVWILGVEAYFTARAHRLDLYKAGSVVVVSLVAAAILGSVTGMFKGSIFG